MMRAVLLCMASLMFPSESFGNGLDKPFQSAVEAVENRQYRVLETVLDSYPELEHYSNNADCSLFCEFSQLLRSPEKGETTPHIDETAINILLDRGWRPDDTPKVIGTLLASVNDFHGEVEEFPINSNVCTQSRDQTFPLANRMIRSGAPLNTLQENARNEQFSTGFFYIYQLCHRPYLCGAEYEIAPQEIALEANKSISLAERKLLLDLVSANALSHSCVSHIILSSCSLCEI